MFHSIICWIALVIAMPISGQEKPSSPETPAVPTASRGGGERIPFTRASGEISVLEGGVLGPKHTIASTALPFDLSIYSNPTGDSISLHLEEGQPFPVQVQLLDAKGKQVQGWDIRLDSAGISQHSTQDLPIGVYFIRLSCEDGTYLSSIPILQVE